MYQLEEWVHFSGSAVNCWLGTVYSHLCNLSQLKKPDFGNQLWLVQGIFLHCWLVQQNSNYLFQRATLFLTLSEGLAWGLNASPWGFAQPTFNSNTIPFIGAYMQARGAVYIPNTTPAQSPFLNGYFQSIEAIYNVHAPPMQVPFQRGLNITPMQTLFRWFCMQHLGVACYCHTCLFSEGWVQPPCKPFLREVCMQPLESAHIPNTNPFNRLHLNPGVAHIQIMQCLFKEVQFLEINFNFTPTQHLFPPHVGVV